MSIMNSTFIQKELAQAGEPSPITPMLMELDGFRIMSDTEVPNEDFLMRLFGKPCFPRRDLTAITGMEKCGKTFFTSMLMAAGASHAPFWDELHRNSDKPLRVMWYDTEQSRQSTKTILTRRVFTLAGLEAQKEEQSSATTTQVDENFFVFNVRSCTYEERMNYLVAGIEAYKPDMVIIDNVSDLLTSINDAEQSVQVIEQLMALATTHDCNIVVVIHLNRSGDKRSLRGWLGTEILHKAFEVFYCEQVEQTAVFAVEHVFTRKIRSTEKLYYKISDDGLPVLTENPKVQPRDSHGRYMSTTPEPYQVRHETVDSFNQKYIVRSDGSDRSLWEWNLRQLFSDAIGNRAQMARDDLQRTVMTLANILQPKYYDKVFTLACEQRVIQTTMDRNGRIVVIPLPPVSS